MAYTMRFSLWIHNSYFQLIIVRSHRKSQYSTREALDEVRRTRSLPFWSASLGILRGVVVDQVNIFNVVFEVGANGFVVAWPDHLLLLCLVVREEAWFGILINESRSGRGSQGIYLFPEEPRFCHHNRIQRQLKHALKSLVSGKRGGGMIVPTKPSGFTPSGISVCCSPAFGITQQVSLILMRSDISARHISHIHAGSQTISNLFGPTSQAEEWFETSVARIRTSGKNQLRHPLYPLHGVFGEICASLTTWRF